ncbi:MAG: DUF1573 domain-containing protein [Bacteroidales bacterium]|nr:DUF1573 domain-containing protein [Bacteroidales bacterium]
MLRFDISIIHKSQNDEKDRFILVLTMSGLTVSSQYVQTTMQITPSEHNFGVFKEEAGRQTFDFTVKNIGTEPLVIQRVTAACGCTAIQQGNQGTGIKPENQDLSWQHLIQVVTKGKSQNQFLFIPMIRKALKLCSC